jgi:hypothetical protein
MCLPLLSGCESLTALQSNAVDTLQVLSGATVPTADDVRGVVEGVQEVGEDIRGRIENVSEGVQKIQEGKELIRAGFGVSGSGSTTEQ